MVVSVGTQPISDNAVGGIVAGVGAVIIIVVMSILFYKLKVLRIKQRNPGIWEDNNHTSVDEDNAIPGGRLFNSIVR